jgi:hypothetical protein
MKLREDVYGNMAVILNDDTPSTDPLLDLYGNMSSEVRPLIDEYDVGDIYYPKGGIDLPTDKDYSAGYMWRYFCRQKNRRDMKILEIKKDEYSKASSHYLYKTIAIKWKLIGDKETTSKINKKIISLASEQLPGINNTLWNPIEFWKNIPDVIQQDVNVTPKYVGKQDYVSSTSTLRIVDPIIMTTTEIDNYILTQDYVVILTQDYVGLYY